MKLYKIRGTSEWVPWDVLYNERGYNSVPCIDMEYKSISPWGTSAGTGYRTNGSGDATYFVSGKTGWYLAYSLPGALGVYPDEATPIQMIKDGVVSDAVWMEFWGAKWYLIQAEIANERYWIIEHGLSELGWEIYEGKDYEFILVDGTTGRVVHGVEQLNEMVFAPTGYFTIEDTGDIVFVEQSPYPIVSHFHVDFDAVQTLADGAYIDTVLPYYTSKLYIAGIVNRVAETVVDFGLTVSNEGGYVRVTNNTGASVTLTRLAIQSMDATDAEVVEVVDGQDNHAYAFKWNDSGTPYWWISYSGERHWTDALGAWSEIPSIVLPTVNVSPWVYFTYRMQDQYYQFNSGSEQNIYTSATAQNSTIQYDSSSIYAVQDAWYKSYAVARTQLQCFNNSGVLAVRNVSSESFRSSGCYYCTCSDSTATVITVYDSSNVAYNTFLYTASGTNYYYVLDGTQTAWTNDLSSIGYSLTPSVVLPTVSKSGNFGSSNILSASTSGTSKTISSGGTWQPYISGTTSTPAFDSSVVYATSYGFNSSSQRIDPTALGYVSLSSRLAWKNISNSSINVDFAQVAVCSSNLATVVTVYNSSNVAYNAFKFTANNTDYYYVLDGVQTDWTDDLSSIGYSLTPSVTAYDIAYGVISSVQLPTFNDGKYINTSFDSLRYYAKGTLSNTGTIRGAFSYPDSVSWYYGTITWNDPSLGDLSDKILTANPSGSQAELGTRQTVFRVIFITDGNITGWHPYDTDDVGTTGGQITAYTYMNGIHSITFYMADQDWISGAYVGRIQFRYLDGITTFNNLDAFDLINVSSGTLSKATTKDRYDMYSVWGGNITIKVGSTAYTGYTRQDKQPESVSGNAWTKLFDENGNYIDYDSTKTYVITSYYVNTISYGNNGEFVIGQYDGKLSIKYYRTGFSGTATWLTYTVL